MKIVLENRKVEWPGSTKYLYNYKYQSLPIWKKSIYYIESYINIHKIMYHLDYLKI